MKSSVFSLAVASAVGLLLTGCVRHGVYNPLYVTDPLYGPATYVEPVGGAYIGTTVIDVTPPPPPRYGRPHGGRHPHHRPPTAGVRPAGGGRGRPRPAAAMRPPQGAGTRPSAGRPATRPAASRPAVRPRPAGGTRPSSVGARPSSSSRQVGKGRGSGGNKSSPKRK
jgi:hypothetical protein